MKFEWMARNPRAGTLLLAVVAIFAIAGIIVSCSGGSTCQPFQVGSSQGCFCAP